jgi:hypothetical protein
VIELPLIELVEITFQDLDKLDQRGMLDRRIWLRGAYQR